MAPAALFLLQAARLDMGMDEQSAQVLTVAPARPATRKQLLSCSGEELTHAFR
jgi:hypothetical protein